MTRLNAITLSCTPAQKASLEALALYYGRTWGDKPNISALMGAIANGELLLKEASEAEKIKVRIERLEVELEKEKSKLQTRKRKLK